MLFIVSLLRLIQGMVCEW